jgi:hypothetical protein
MMIQALVIIFKNNNALLIWFFCTFKFVYTKFYSCSAVKTTSKICKVYYFTKEDEFYIEQMGGVREAIIYYYMRISSRKPRVASSKMRQRGVYLIDTNKIVIGPISLITNFYIKRNENIQCI